MAEGDQPEAAHQRPRVAHERPQEDLDDDVPDVLLGRTQGKDRDQGEGDQREDGEDAERRQARLAKIPPGRTNMSTMKITNAIT